ncbi:M48 family metallopeptidase [Pelagimonas varians]|uniref:Peptidase family M48 n=1 Tax=Pelagimonas varians TaxID=696760 RepID=A0A238L4G5_9RHOB|nr:M48 family metallopeptidase [Pelagimonas varians]PYG26422.1 peptidase M48-like protein [Pelagimonas varians]SMX49964.1 Peptidase family M48 [Pelagimonas varians]
MTRLLPFIFILLSACASVPMQETILPPATGDSVENAAIRQQAVRAARQFVSVVETVEPVAERECRNAPTRLNCDFQIVVDDRPDQPPNAFQTVDSMGRPIIAFNLGLIASVQNADELAFIMGHEAAHHILDHLEKTRETATYGAVIMSGIAAISGADVEEVKSAEELGAVIGARSFSKEYELEADELGTIIAARAGYDPVKGSEFFTRIPDPGNKFLGSHPPNAARRQIVRDTAAQL